MKSLILIALIAQSMAPVDIPQLNVKYLWDNEVRLKWNASRFADGYIVDICYGRECKQIKTRELFVKLPRMIGKVRFRVLAFNKFGKSKWSDDYYVEFSKTDAKEIAAPVISIDARK